MSKMDAMRAMREARYERMTSGATKRASSSAPVRPPAPARGPTPTETVADTGEAAAEDPRCGHRAISGRTCTREQGHAAKSHRYS